MYSALFFNVLLDRLRAGIASRADEVSVAPEGLLLPEVIRQEVTKLLPDVEGRLALETGSDTRRGQGRRCIDKDVDVVGVHFHHVDGETAFVGDVGEQRLDLVSDVLLAEQFLAVLAGEDEMVLQQVLTVAGVVVLVFLSHDDLQKRYTPDPVGGVSKLYTDSDGDGDLLFLLLGQGVLVGDQFAQHPPQHLSRLDLLVQMRLEALGLEPRQHAVDAALEESVGVLVTRLVVVRVGQGEHRLDGGRGLAAVLLGFRFQPLLLLDLFRLDPLVRLDHLLFGRTFGVLQHVTGVDLSLLEFLVGRPLCDVEGDVVDQRPLHLADVAVERAESQPVVSPAAVLLVHDQFLCHVLHLLEHDLPLTGLQVLPTLVNILEGDGEALVEPLQHPLPDAPHVGEDGLGFVAHVVHVDRHIVHSFLKGMVVGSVPALL